MSNTVFIFGAGASIGNSNNLEAKFPHYGLPVVKDLPFYSDSFIRDLTSNIDLIGSFEQSILESIRNIPIEIRQYISFDTYGRMLSATGNVDKLARLKLFLIAFFKFYQDKRQPDLRYDLLLASIIEGVNKNFHIPTEYSFISWNYDTLFEKSVLKFFPNKSLNEIFSYNSEYTPAKVNFVKLNGSIGGPTNCEYPLTFITENIDDKNYYNDLLAQIYSVFNKINRTYGDFINFSWEVILTDSRVRCASSLLENANTINIIGYSLPNINRAIDKQIFARVGSKETVTINIQCGANSEYIQEKLERVYLKEWNSKNYQVNIVKGLDEFPIF